MGWRGSSCGRICAIFKDCRLLCQCSWRFYSLSRSHLGLFSTWGPPCCCYRLTIRTCWPAPVCFSFCSPPNFNYWSLRTPLNSWTRASYFWQGGVRRWRTCSWLTSRWNGLRWPCSWRTAARRGKWSPSWRGALFLSSSSWICGPEWSARMHCWPPCITTLHFCGHCAWRGCWPDWGHACRASRRGPTC